MCRGDHQNLLLAVNVHRCLFVPRYCIFFTCIMLLWWEVLWCPQWSTVSLSLKCSHWGEPKLNWDKNIMFLIFVDAYQLVGSRIGKCVGSPCSDPVPVLTQWCGCYVTGWVLFPLPSVYLLHNNVCWGLAHISANLAIAPYSKYYPLCFLFPWNYIT